MARRRYRAVPSLYAARGTLPQRLDAHSCIHQCSRRAGCITKGARPVRRAGIRIRRQRCRTALMLDPTRLFRHRRRQALRSVHHHRRAQPLFDSLSDRLPHGPEPTKGDLSRCVFAPGSGRIPTIQFTDCRQFGSSRILSRFMPNRPNPLIDRQ